MEDVFNKLNTEMQSLKLNQKLTELNKRLAQIKELKKLDAYLCETQSFLNLFETYSQDKVSVGENILQMSETFFNSNDFYNLAVKLDKLKSLDEENYENMIKRIDFKLSKVGKSCFNMIRNMDRFNAESLTIFRDEFDLLSQAKKLIGSHLDGLDGLNRHEMIIKSGIECFVKRIIKNLDSSNFDVHEKIVELAEVKKILNEFLDQNLLDEMDKAIDSENRLVADRVENFKKYPIEDYLQHAPKDIYEKLAIYDEVRLGFENFLVQNYKNRLDQDKASDNAIKICARSISFLPEKLMKLVEDLIHEAKKERNDALFYNELEKQKNG